MAVGDHYDYSLAGPLVHWPKTPPVDHRRARPAMARPVLPRAPAIVRLVDNNPRLRTAVAMALGCCLAHGVPFLGCRSAALPVLYLAGPANSDALQAAKAWRRHHGLVPTHRLQFDPDAMSWPVQHRWGKPAAAVLCDLPDALDRAADKLGEPVRVLILDEMLRRQDQGRLWYPRTGAYQWATRALTSLAEDRDLVILVTTHNRHEWLAAKTVLAVKPATAAQPYPSLVMLRSPSSPAIPFDPGRDHPWPVVSAIERDLIAAREEARPVLLTPAQRMLLRKRQG